MTATLAPRTVEAGAPPWWFEFVELTVELGVGASGNKNPVGRWDRAHWDKPATGTWSGLEPVWVPVDPCMLLEVGVSRGRDRWIDRFGASSATLRIQDPDGRLSWDAAASDDLLAVRPGREVRIRALHVGSGVQYPVWRGFLETIDDTFDPGGVPIAAFTAQDSYAQLAHIDLLERDPPVGAGESSDARVNRLLDLADWPLEWRDIDPGMITVQATNLARPIADDLGITADSEGGAVFADRRGRICFRNRDWLRTDPHATELQATIGGADEDVCAAGYETTRSAGDIVNDIQLARAGGTMQHYIDAGSISRYRHRTYQRSDFVCEDDAQVGVLARRILNTRASGQVRIPKLTITPGYEPDDWAFVCAVDYGWRLEVHYPTTAGTDWTRTVLVQGVDHRITPGGWTCELRVDDAVAGLTAADVWDGEHGWDRALWSAPV
ncbi:MAG TPA: hypothetical protein VKB59_22735 [Micromonosporaceae bacterium]|nr:hypothetical protein [Micromonosporaceae bacterium]